MRTASHSGFAQPSSLSTQSLGEWTGLNKYAVVNQEATDVVRFLSLLPACAFGLPLEFVDLVGVEASAFGANFLTSAVYITQTIVDDFVGLFLDA